MRIFVQRKLGMRDSLGPSHWNYLSGLISSVALYQLFRLVGSASTILSLRPAESLQQLVHFEEELTLPTLVYGLTGILSFSWFVVTLYRDFSRDSSSSTLLVALSTIVTSVALIALTLQLQVFLLGEGELTVSQFQSSRDLLSKLAASMLAITSLPRFAIAVLVGFLMLRRGGMWGGAMISFATAIASLAGLSATFDTDPNYDALLAIPVFLIWQVVISLIMTFAKITSTKRSVEIVSNSKEF